MDASLRQSRNLTHGLIEDEVSLEEKLLKQKRSGLSLHFGAVL